MCKAITTPREYERVCFRQIELEDVSGERQLTLKEQAEFAHIDKVLEAYEREVMAPMPAGLMGRSS